MGEYEGFITKTYKTGGSLVITIPNKLVEFAGLKEGENVRVMIKKVEVPNKEIEKREGK